MLPKSGRIRLTREFERIFATRRSFSGRFVRLAFALSALPYTRCGIVISTKVSKKAVVRNKLRRRVRSIFSEYQSRLLPPRDIVVICLPSAATADFSEFKADIKRSLAVIFSVVL